MTKPPRLKTLGPRLKPIDTRTVRPPAKVVESFYSSAEWKTTARAIRERDGYKCVKCGSRDGRLYVDHRVERKDGGQDYDHDNLETLCALCHGAKTTAERVKRGAWEY
jgi:5-methylcytosine-specific restriction endonuclease McrA